METRDTPLCGFLNLLKPPGMTSAAAVGFVKRRLHGEKIGHAGTLDPEAAGILPLMIGRATRLFDDLQEKEKTYVAEIAFAGETDTQDAQGTLTVPAGAPPALDALLGALAGFVGDITQTPPAYSALKVDGHRLYDLARRGEAPEIAARPARVLSLRLVCWLAEDAALLRVTCASGLYVRTLCQDIGRAVGSPAHMRFLLRERAGAFALDTARTLEEVAAAFDAGAAGETLLPLDAPFSHRARLIAPPALDKPLLNGVAVPLAAFGETAFSQTKVGLAGEKPRVYLSDGRFAGLLAAEDGLGRMRPLLIG